MKRLLLIGLLLCTAYIFAQTIPTGVVRRNARGVWKLLYITMDSNSTKNKTIDTSNVSELKFRTYDNGDTVYNITDKPYFRFQLENGELVRLNVLSEGKPEAYLLSITYPSNENKNEDNADSEFRIENEDSDDGFNKEKYTFNGIPLHRKVKVVESFADFKVQIVNSFPDIKVKTVESFPDDCGEWQFVKLYDS